MILYLNLLTSLIMATTDTAASPRFTPQDLPYAYDALAPAISEETMHYHHDKHYAGYVDKLNELIVDTFFRAPSELAAGVIAARDALGLRCEVIGVVSRHAPAYALSFERGNIAVIK